MDLSPVGAHLAGLLPEFFNGAGYVVQFSSTRQHIGNEGVAEGASVVLALGGDHECPSEVMAAAVAEADQGGVTSGLIDCGLFDPIQLHYVAPPELGAGG